MDKDGCHRDDEVYRPVIGPGGIRPPGSSFGEIVSIMKVKGIRERTFNKIKDSITVR